MKELISIVLIIMITIGFLISLPFAMDFIWERWFNE